MPEPNDVVRAARYDQLRSKIRAAVGPGRASVLIAAAIQRAADTGSDVNRELDLVLRRVIEDADGDGSRS